MAECQELLIFIRKQTNGILDLPMCDQQPAITKDPVHARRLRRELHWETQQCLA